MSSTVTTSDVVIDRGAVAPEGKEVMTEFPVVGVHGRQRYEIHCGDARDVVPTLPEVHCVVTSPPYLGQRVYGHSESEIGRGEDVEGYIAELCDLFDAIPLHQRGSLWVNMGDKRRGGALLGIPARFEVAMIDRGWHFLDDPTWAKGVVHVDGTTRGGFLPEPAWRRLNGNAHEKVWRFARTTEAWSDVCAVNIPRRGVEGTRYLPPELMSCETALEGRRCPNVWQVPMGQTSEDHHAAYPKALCERPIAMTAPVWINPDGSLPARIVASLGYDEARGPNRVIGKRTDEDGRKRSGRNDTGRPYTPRKPMTTGWMPGFDPEGEPSIVLDPLMGTGTTGEVALKLGRSFIGIDLYPSYCEMARHGCEETLRFLQERNLDPLALIR